MYVYVNFIQRICNMKMGNTANSAQTKPSGLGNNRPNLGNSKHTILQASRKPPPLYIFTFHSIPFQSEARDRNIRIIKYQQSLHIYNLKMNILACTWRI